LLIAVQVSLALTTPLAAAVQVRPHYGVAIQAVYDRRGDPALVANFTPDGALAKPRWSICAPPDTSVCKPVASSSQELTAGTTKAGTVFKATAVYRGKTYSAISAVWQGQVQPVRRPGLRGTARVGGQVTPTAASWRGGWKAEPNYHQQEGAESGGRAAATDQPQSAPAARTGSSVRIARRFRGWYLFAFDQRFAADTAFATPGYSSPYSVPPLTAGPTVARSRAYGPVG
jgi:hypothetical protein